MKKIAVCKRESLDNGERDNDDVLASFTCIMPRYEILVSFTSGNLMSIKHTVRCTKGLMIWKITKSVL